MGAVAAVAAAAAAAALAAIWASDSFLVSSSLSSAFLAAAVRSSSAFLRMISKICLFCSCVIVDGTCRVADGLGVS